MNHHFNLSARLWVFALITLFAATSASADQPSRGEDARGSKHGKKSEERQKDRNNDSSRESGKHFDDTNRRIINDYYGAKFRTGKCPPGLAKKNNGCLPPGQAKKWAVGQPLPADLKQYNLPKDLLVKLPAPPDGHRYVRIASDILLIAAGTSMIIDAIEDIGR
ncbi:MAG: RcnB family protein [Gallionella sp.]